MQYSCGRPVSIMNGYNYYLLNPNEYIKHEKEKDFYSTIVVVGHGNVHDRLFER